MSVFVVFLVRIFPHSDCLSKFSPNARKYGPEKFRIPTIFTQWVDIGEAALTVVAVGMIMMLVLLVAVNVVIVMLVL